MECVEGEKTPKMTVNQRKAAVDSGKTAASARETTGFKAATGKVATGVGQVRKAPEKAALAKPVAEKPVAAKPGQRSWNELFVRFHNHKASRCEASTLKQVEWNLLPVIAEMEQQGITLQDFTAAALEARIARRKRDGIKNSTSRTECMLMNAMLTLGVKEKFLRKNPLIAYEMPPKVRPYVPTPTLTSLKALLKTVHDLRRPSKAAGAAYLSREKNTFLHRRDTAIIVFAARTGERPGEIFRTALSDYQPDEGRVAIRIAKDREPRFVPIYGDVIAVINDWLKVRPKDCPSDYLFVSDRGLQMSVNTWAKEFKKYAVAAGMAEITPRSLRHFGLTLMAETNLLAAATAAGHSSLSTTRGYLHNNFAHTRAALAKVAHLDMTGLEDGRRKKRII